MKVVLVALAAQARDAPLLRTNAAKRFARLASHAVKAGAPPRHRLADMPELPVEAESAPLVSAWRSPSDDHRRPRQPAAEADESDVIVLLNVPLFVRLAQRNRDRRRRSIAVARDIAEE